MWRKFRLHLHYPVWFQFLFLWPAWQVHHLPQETPGGDQMGFLFPQAPQSWRVPSVPCSAETVTGESPNVSPRLRALPTVSWVNRAWGRWEGWGPARLCCCVLAPRTYLFPFWSHSLLPSTYYVPSTVLDASDSNSHGPSLCMGERDQEQVRKHIGASSLRGRGVTQGIGSHV